MFGGREIKIGLRNINFYQITSVGFHFIRQKEIESLREIKPNKLVGVDSVNN